MFLIFHTTHTRIDTYTKHIRRQINHKVMLRFVVAKGWVGVDEKRQLTGLLLQSLDRAS